MATSLEIIGAYNRISAMYKMKGVITEKMYGKLIGFGSLPYLLG